MPVSKPGYESMGRAKPPAHYFVEIPELPTLSIIDPSTVCPILLAERWEDRSISQKTIPSLQAIIDAFIAAKPDLEKYPQIHLKNVVIQDATLIGTSIDFDIHITESIILGDFNVRSCDVKRFRFSGKIEGQLSLVGVGGRATISLGNAELNGIHFYDLDIEGFNAAHTTIGAVCIGKMDGSPHLSFHECLIQDNILIGDMLNTTTLSFYETQLSQMVTIGGVYDTVEFHNCELDRDLAFQDAVSRVLNLKGSKSAGRIDLRNIKFETLCVSDLMIEGQLTVKEEQLRPARPRFSLGKFWLPISTWDTPSRLAGDGLSDEASLRSMLDQLPLLRENFHRMPGAAEIEDYCAYRMMEATRKLRRRRIPGLLSKHLFGHMIVTERIVRTGLIVIVFLAIVYGLGEWAGVGELLQTNDITGKQESVYTSGLLVGLMRSVYFTTITFTTVGYGDMHPTRTLKLVAMVNSLMGLVLASTFIASLTRRFYRW